MEEVEQKVIVDALSAPEGELVAQVQAQEPGKQTPEPNTDPPKTEPVNPVQLNPVWDILKSRISTEEAPFELPENIIKGEWGEGKTEADVLIEFIQSNTDYSSLVPEDDDFITQYRLAKQNENFSLTDFVDKIKSTDNNLTGADYIADYYKKNHLKSESNPNGYTTEDIDNYIKSKSRIELDKEANALKEVERNKAQKQIQLNQEEIKKKEIEAFNKNEEENKNIISQFTEANKLSTEFFGIQFSDAERTEFLSALPDMFKRDPITRKSKMDEYLSSNESMIELAALVWYSKDRVKASINKKVEQVKKDLEKRLGRESQSEGNIVIPGTVDLSALARPEA